MGFFDEPQSKVAKTYGDKSIIKNNNAEDTLKYKCDFCDSKFQFNKPVHKCPNCGANIEVQSVED